MPDATPLHPVVTPRHDSQRQRWERAVNLLCARMRKLASEDHTFADTWVDPAAIAYHTLAASALHALFASGDPDDGARESAFRRIALAFPCPWRIYPDHNAAAFVRDAILTVAETDPARFQGVADDDDPLWRLDPVAMASRLSQQEWEQLAVTLTNWKEQHERENGDGATATAIRGAPPFVGPGDILERILAEENNI